MTFLYIPIFPLGIIISFVGFIFCYWLEKYNFANIYKKPEMLNRTIVDFYVNYFVVVLFAYGVGDYIFLNDAYGSRAWPLVNIIVFGVLIIIPYHQILSHDFLNFEESELYNKTYNDVYLKFNTDYERANPMTKKEGMKQYLKVLYEQGKINKDEYDKSVNDIDNANLMELYYKQRSYETIS